MLNIRDCVDHAEGRFPEQVCVRCGSASHSYRELADRCRRLTRVLLAHGLNPGERVAVLALNCHRYFEAFLAIPSAALVLVPLNTRLAEAELCEIVDDCVPRVLITDRTSSEFLGGALASRFERVITWPDEYESLIDAAAIGAATGPDNLSGDEGPATADLAALFYTGGTTGRAKGVMLSHENLVANSFHKTIAVGLRPDDVFLAAPAMFHVAGIAPLLSLLTLGAQIVFVPGFDPAGSLDVIERERITMMFPVPTMLVSMIAEQQQRRRDISSLRMLGHAGSAITEATVRQAIATFPGVELAQFYGATETASILTCQHDEQDPSQERYLGSAGQPVIGVSVRVVDESGNDVAVGETGEVLARGRNVTKGYWHNESATAAAFTNGWYRTGDVGRFDETRHLFIVDRIKDMIVTGGENVYSTEVENALSSFPGVIETAVLGVPHEHWGEAVHAIVVMSDLDAARPDVVAALQAHCRAQVAGYKVPKSIEVRATPLPKSGPGKVLKRLLREEAASRPVEP